MLPDFVEAPAQIVETRKRVHSTRTRRIIVASERLLGCESMIRCLGALQIFKRTFVGLLPAAPFSRFIHHVNP